MNQYIKNILSTRGWQDIEKMFNDKIGECEKADQNPELDDATYAREGRARAIAGKKLRELLNNIKISAGGDPQDKISYK